MYMFQRYCDMQCRTPSFYFMWPNIFHTHQNPQVSDGQSAAGDRCQKGFSMSWRTQPEGNVYYLNRKKGGVQIMVQHRYYSYRTIVSWYIKIDKLPIWFNHNCFIGILNVITNGINLKITLQGRGVGDWQVFRDSKDVYLFIGFHGIPV